MQLRQKIGATIGILGASALVVFGAVVYPSARKIDDLEKGIGAEKLKIEERYLRRQQIRNSLEGLGDAREKIDALGAVAVREDRELDFINALETVATETGVEQDIILETANQKDLSKWERDIPLVLQVTGPYPDLLRYLAGLERMPYFVTIRSLQIETPVERKAVNPRGLVQLRIQATVYWQSKNAPAFLRPEAQE